MKPPQAAGPTTLRPGRGLCPLSTLAGMARVTPYWTPLLTAGPGSGCNCWLSREGVRPDPARPQVHTPYSHSYPLASNTQHAVPAKGEESADQKESHRSFWRGPWGWWWGISGGNLLWWLKLCPPHPKHMSESRSLVLVNRTLRGKRVFAGVIKVRSSWIRVDPTSNDRFS